MLQLLTRNLKSFIRVWISFSAVSYTHLDVYKRQAYQKAKDKTAFRAKHEAELVIFEAAKSTLLAVQGDRKLPRMKALQAEQERLTERCV